MIDTLSIVRNLTAAGVERKKAEACAEVIAYAADQQQGKAATKGLLRSELRAELNALEVRLAGWIIGAGFVYTGLLLAVIYFTFSS